MHWMMCDDNYINRCTAHIQKLLLPSKFSANEEALNFISGYSIVAYNIDSASKHQLLCHEGGKCCIRGSSHSSPTQISSSHARISRASYGDSVSSAANNHMQNWHMLLQSLLPQSLVKLEVPRESTDACSCCITIQVGPPFPSFHSILGILNQI